MVVAFHIRICICVMKLTVCVDKSCVIQENHIIQETTFTRTPFVLRQRYYELVIMMIIVLMQHVYCIILCTYYIITEQYILA